MAKKIMPKTRLTKTNVTTCDFCRLGNRYEAAYNTLIATAKERYPERETNPWWRVDDKAPGVPGYKITTLRLATEGDWGVRDGVVENGTVTVCENCMLTIVKCFAHLANLEDTAEEITYARKEIKELPLPTLDEVFVKEEE